MSPEQNNAARLLELDVAAAARALESDLEAGLKQSEAQARLAAYGHNEVQERKTNPWLRFAKKFWGLSAWMLELIILLSLLLGKYVDLVIVTGLLVVNAILSFAQEQRASAVVEMLRRRLQVNARVKRDGTWQT
ncbi:MAG: cation-transporting P-type ATPase, partial [Anaerolineae bacterium]